MTRTAPAPRSRLLVVAASNELYGSDRCLLYALPLLVEHFDVTVAFPAPGPGTSFAVAAGAKVTVLPDFALRRRHLTWRGLCPWLLRACTAMARLHREHRRRPFDVVYSNTLATGIGPVLAVLWGSVHALHAHELPLRPPWMTKCVLWISRVAADVLICTSEYLRGEVIRRAPNLVARTVVVHNGVTVFDLPGVSDCHHGALQISCVGRIHPGKGHRVLLEALRQATESGSDWEVHLYGDHLAENIGLRQELERFADEHDLGRRVRWHGFVSDPYKLYAEADVAVVPSDSPESFSLVCAEAQMMGLPVVATRPGGPAEVVCDGLSGFLVPAGDATALKNVIEKLEDPVLRSRMGEAARLHALAHFSDKAFAVALLETLVAARPRRRGAARRRRRLHTRHP